MMTIDKCCKKEDDHGANNQDDMTPTLVADPSPSSSHSYGEILAKQKRVIARARYAVVV